MWIVQGWKQVIPRTLRASAALRGRELEALATELDVMISDGGAGMRQIGQPWRHGEPRP